ncbi:META domain-containing protein [Erwinia aphidicola]|uniref:META domain-containing protein n=1 Tax=Erwinia aphidicola TaxID=68334 RepID=UPI003D19AF48
MKKVTLLLLGAVALSGCSHSNTSPTDASQLANRQFVLSAVDGQTVVPHEGIRPGIGFSEGLKVSGVMCNRFFGQGKVEQGRLSVPQLASTRMLCSNADLNKWEQTLTQMLMNGAEVKVDEQSLTLTGSGHVLQYQAQ